MRPACSCRARAASRPSSLYVGPMEFQRLGAIGAGDLRGRGLRLRRLHDAAHREYVVSPLFRFLGRFLPNYGLVIILFAMFIKLPSTR
jgi:hypothetical protein